MPYNKHLISYESLVTPYEETRAGFISLALEKNKNATPFIEEAKALKSIAGNAKCPKDLLNIPEINNSLLTASGLSEKAKNHLNKEDKREAITNLIETFLEPAGLSFVDELVYRFLLTRGDSLGGSMRNLAGKIGEWKFTRILISTLSVHGVEFGYLDAATRQWLHSTTDPELEKRVKGLYWSTEGKYRTLINNLTVPIVKKNVDMCLFDCSPKEMRLASSHDSIHYKPEKYLALGELKGGIDPAGADEHWKTASTALERIRNAFSREKCKPYTFFVGAAIETEMAKEIYNQLKNNTLTNGANLTNEKQTVSLCKWLISI